MFGLRRLRSNPPRSLWLQHIHRMCCLTRRAHTAVPPLHTLREPTASALRGATLGARIDKYRSLIMPLRFVRQLRTQTAQSLVLSVKLDARYGHRLAIPVPSSKLHIPLISRLRKSIRFGCGVKPHPQLFIINYSLLIQSSQLDYFPQPMI